MLEAVLDNDEDLSKRRPVGTTRPELDLIRDAASEINQDDQLAVKNSKLLPTLIHGFAALTFYPSDQHDSRPFGCSAEEAADDRQRFQGPTAWSSPKTQR